jgi:hypothetical protein
MRRLLLIALLLPASLSAQLLMIPRTYAVGTTALPTCNTARTGFNYIVTDGDDPDDCTTGSGSDVHWCGCDGTNWVPQSSIAFRSSSAFIIGNGAPNNSLVVEATTGDVGVGTGTPDQDHHVYRASGTVTSKVETGGSSTAVVVSLVNATPDNFQLRLQTDGDFAVNDGSNAIFELQDGAPAGSFVMIADGGIKLARQAGALPTCNSTNQDRLYNDQTGDLCWCDGSSWTLVGGGGSCA